MSYIEEQAPMSPDPSLAIILRPTWDAAAASWQFLVRPVSGEPRLFSTWELAYLFIERLLEAQTPTAVGTVFEPNPQRRSHA